MNPAVGVNLNAAVSVSERYQTLKRIRWPSTQPLIYNKEGDEWVLSTSHQSEGQLIDSSNDLKDVEIVGHTDHVEKLRKIFADSAATVIEEAPKPPATPTKLRRNPSKPPGSPSIALRASSVSTPSTHKLDAAANKSPLFQSLSNIYAYSPTDEGISSDSGGMLDPQI